MDKELFKQQGLIALRGKSFPIKSSVGVLKYRRISPSGKHHVPITMSILTFKSNQATIGHH